MKKNLLAIIPVLTIALFSCAQAKKTTSKTSPKKPDFEYVMMKRTPCFGQCPTYIVELFKDGTVKYHGQQNVKDTGIYSKNIGVAAVQKVFDEFRKYRVDTCSEQYELPIADLPGIYYNYTVGGVEKKIVNANFGPDFLKVLANEMDAIGGKDIDHSKWNKIKAGK